MRSSNSLSPYSTIICLLIVSSVCYCNAFGQFASFLRYHPKSHQRSVVQLQSTVDSSSGKDLLKLQQALQKRELEEQRMNWLGDVSSLPFECTGCGKCCRTKGSVFMSPKEIAAAADYMNVTADLFIEEYATSKLQSLTKEEDNLPWILVKNQETDKGPGCVFLDNETNFCKIYPVRPIQCSTYPFWPEIMESEKHWNSEVRRHDDDLSSSLPTWTPDEGGCEGMKILNEQNSLPNAENAVSLNVALEQLSLYQRTDRRLPRDRDFEKL